MLFRRRREGRWGGIFNAPRVTGRLFERFYFAEGFDAVGLSGREGGFTRPPPWGGIATARPNTALRLILPPSLTFLPSAVAGPNTAHTQANSRWRSPHAITKKNSLPTATPGPVSLALSP